MDIGQKHFKGRTDQIVVAFLSHLGGKNLKLIHHIIQGILYSGDIHIVKDIPNPFENLVFRIFRTYLGQLVPVLDIQKRIPYLADSRHHNPLSYLRSVDHVEIAGPAGTDAGLIQPLSCIAACIDIGNVLSCHIQGLLTGVQSQKSHAQA